MRKIHKGLNDKEKGENSARRITTSYVSKHRAHSEVMGLSD